MPNLLGLRAIGPDRQKTPFRLIGGMPLQQNPAVFSKATNYGPIQIEGDSLRFRGAGVQCDQAATGFGWPPKISLDMTIRPSGRNSGIRQSV